MVRCLSKFNVKYKNSELVKRQGEVDFVSKGSHGTEKACEYPAGKFSRNGNRCQRRGLVNWGWTVLRREVRINTAQTFSEHLDPRLQEIKDKAFRDDLHGPGVSR